MDAAGRIQSRKRSTDKTTDWSRCIICQTAAVRKATQRMGLNGIERVNYAVSERKKYKDYDKWDVIERLEAVNLKNVRQDTPILYHKTCYGTFTSSMHLDRLKKRYGTETIHEPMDVETSTSTETTTRSKVKALDKSLCIFCQEQNTRRRRTRLVQKMPVSDKILKASTKDSVMDKRLAGITDLVAADARYHLPCYVQCMRNTGSLDDEHNDETDSDHIYMCMQEVVHEVDIGIAKGDIYTLLDVWERYSVLVSEFNIDTGSYKQHRTRFKEKLQSMLHGTIEFVPQLDPHQPQLLFSTVPAKIVVQLLKETQDELDDKEDGIHGSQFIAEDIENMLALHHTALKIRADITDSPKCQNCASVNTDDASKLIHESLFLFLSVMLTGEVEQSDDEDIDDDIRLFSQFCSRHCVCCLKG